MMEIEFRGALCHNGRFVYGNLVKTNDNNYYIIPFSVCETDGHHVKIYDDNPYCVIKETVGQYIGRKDKYGNKIFEGDILGGQIKLYVEWCDKSNMFTMKHHDCGCFCHSCSGDVNLYEYEDDELEIIGNILYNKGLLYC